MKVVLAFVVLIVGISAVPQRVHKVEPLDFSDERLVGGIIESVIQSVAQSIRDAGMDPMHVEKEASSFGLPVPVIFNYVALIEDLISNGLSNIVVHRINYNVLTSRLTFDIELPLIDGSVGDAAADVEVFGNKLDFRASGKVEILRVRVNGQVRVNIGIISGISIRNLTIDLSLGDIHSDLHVVILGVDISEQVNSFIGELIPNTIKEFSNEINELLELVLLDIINELL